MTDVMVVIGTDGQVELRLGPESGLLRERLGMTAWVALEALVRPDGRGGVAVATSARDLAGKLGIGKDRAAAALAVLRDAGMLVRVARGSVGSVRRASLRDPTARVPRPRHGAPDGSRPSDR